MATKPYPPIEETPKMVNEPVVAYHAEPKFIPNSETIVAIEEIRNGKYAGELDMSSFDAFMKSINSIE